MRQVDKLIAHLVRFHAEALVAISNAPVVIRTSTGDRTSTQVLDHPQVMAIVTEIAPPSCLADLRNGRPARFGYDHGPAAVTVDVAPSGSAWRVVISLGVSAGVPRASAPPRDVPGGHPGLFPGCPCLGAGHAVPGRKRASRGGLGARVWRVVAPAAARRAEDARGVRSPGRRAARGGHPRD